MKLIKNKKINLTNTNQNLNTENINIRNSEQVLVKHRKEIKRQMVTNFANLTLDEQGFARIIQTTMLKK